MEIYVKYNLAEILAGLPSDYIIEQCDSCCKIRNSWHETARKSARNIGNIGVGRGGPVG